MDSIRNITPARLIEMASSATGMLLIAAFLSFIGMALCSPIIESITFSEISDDGATIKTEVPMDAPYIHVGNARQMAAIHFWYRGFGNSKLQLTPRYCFYKGFDINGTHYDFTNNTNNNEENACQSMTLDLRNDLFQGDNTLVVVAGPAVEHPEQYSPHVGFTIGTQLFGKNLSQSLCTTIFVAALLGLVWLHLEAEGFGIIVRIMFMVMIGIFLDCLCTIPQYAYSLDLEKHIPYFQYMAEHPLAPHGYTGPEGWHPFLYYQACAWIAKLCQMMGTFDPWTGVRVFSLVCYTTSMYYGMKTLRLVLRGLPFHLALALLFFWPSGLLNAAWFFNDVLIYPLYAASFYYTLVWYESDQTSPLLKALILCGIAFIVKMSAFVPAGILVCCVLVRLLRRDLSFRFLFEKRLLWGEAAFGIGIISHFSGVVYDKLMGLNPPPHLGGDGGFSPTVEQMFFVNIKELLDTPFFNSWEIQEMWVVTIKTLLFTNSYWNQPFLGSSLMLMLFVMGAFGVVYLFTRGRGQFASDFPIIGGCILPFCGLIAFSMMAHNFACRDFRYIQPALVAMVAVYMLAVQETKRKDYTLLYYFGCTIAVLFPIFSVLLYYAQMHPELRHMDWLHV